MLITVIKSNIVKYYYNYFLNVIILLNVIYSSDQSWISSIISFLQSSESHDPSEITLIWWFDAQETFLIIINVENTCAA